jgi:pyruvate/oxaloacetate carboxyltransferase
MWSFSQAAARYAAENKRRISAKTRNDYRMGANSRVNRAFQDLETKLLTSPTTTTMSVADFKLLKQAIENFRVRIIVHDSITLGELKEQRTQAANEIDSIVTAISSIAHTTTTPTAEADAAYTTAYAELIQTYREKEYDLVDWCNALSGEIRRIEPYGYSFKEPAAAVPSQHVQIDRASGRTLRNILTPQTIRRKFISLHKLTQTIRIELLQFLLEDSRSNDRAEVVRQIKQSCLAAKKQKQV